MPSPESPFSLPGSARSVFEVLPLITLPALVALSLAATIALTAEAQRAPLRCDLLFAGGRVVDGTGAPWFRGDVCVAGDRIAAVGDLGQPGDDRRIDATGLVVAPGFIDMLGQSEYYVLVDGRAASKITQGITTEITGEGGSIAPTAPRDRRRQGDLGVLRRDARLDDPRRLLEGLRARAPGHQSRHVRGGGRGARLVVGEGRSRRDRRRARSDGGGGRPGHGGGRARPLHLAHLHPRPIRLDRGDRRPRQGGRRLRRLLHHPPARRGRRARALGNRQEPGRGLPDRPRSPASPPRSTT